MFLKDKFRVAEPWRPIPIAYEAAIIGPLLYPPNSDLGRKNPLRVAPHAPSTHAEAMQQVLECREAGATSVHIHPIEEGTGKHKKTTALYERRAKGARKMVPGIVVNNDASLNGVGLSTKSTIGRYLDTRLAGLINDAPPDVFTLFATNEALMVANTPGGHKRQHVETFVRVAGQFLQEHKITALAEISQDPYGMLSVRRGLEILKQADITLPGLSFSFLVGGTAKFPVHSDSLLEYTDAKGTVHKETPKMRFMRLVAEAIQIKDENKLNGPITFGTIVPAKKDDPRTLEIQDTVWQWIAEAAIRHPQAMRKYGLIVKAGLEEWAGFRGEHVSNPDAVAITRSFMEGMRNGPSPTFTTVTDIQTVRGWVHESERLINLVKEQNFSRYPRAYEKTYREIPERTEYRIKPIFGDRGPFSGRRYPEPETVGLLQTQIVPSASLADAMRAAALNSTKIFPKATRGQGANPGVIESETFEC